MDRWAGTANDRRHPPKCCQRTLAGPPPRAAPLTLGRRQQVYDSRTPHEEGLPEPWDRASSMHQLIVLRLLRPTQPRAIGGGSWAGARAVTCDGWSSASVSLSTSADNTPTQHSIRLAASIRRSVLPSPGSCHMSFFSHPHFRMKPPFSFLWFKCPS